MVLALGVALTGAVSASGVQGTGAATPGWTTAHLDAGRTGNDTADPGLGGSVSPSWTSPTLDGRVYGEPLLLNNIVYVATQRNTVYALDAGNGAAIWSLPLAQPPYNLPAVPKANVTHAAGVGSGNGNIDPMGIIGTPVIDPAMGSAGTLFAVAETWDGSTESTIQHALVAVDLAGHTATSPAPANIDPYGVGFDSGSTRALEQERGALSLAGGKVVVPYGGLSGDPGNYHGFASACQRTSVARPIPSRSMPQRREPTPTIAQAGSGPLWAPQWTDQGTST
jgi:polyvinyl alcohol dehydrogenase (cytochrome)